jgi:hypothetical protein
MTKKKQKQKQKTPRPTTKTHRKPTPAELAEAERILTIWKDAAKVGLGAKRFAAAVMTRYEPRFRAQILVRLIVHEDKFDSTAEANTKTVAQDTGLVCAMMTTGAEVSKDTFQSVFLLMQTHPLCPGPAGAGTWCDIQL